MKYKALILLVIFYSTTASADNTEDLKRELRQLRQQSLQLQRQLNHLEKQLVKQTSVNPAASEAKKLHGESHLQKIHHSQAQPTLKNKGQQKPIATRQHPSSPKSPRPGKRTPIQFHSSTLTVHSVDNDPESLEFYPTALVADEHVVSYIAGTPVVTSPYLGSRPAFDGSDYIVNISSINRDIRLMQQRRRLYRAYHGLGYPLPNKPILAFSGKVEPVTAVGDPFLPNNTFDVTLGSSELDLAAILNNTVEAYLSLAYDQSPPDVGGQRLSNSSIDLNMGFVNIGDLDKSPFYFTGGQLYAPFGRFSTAMVSAPLTMVMARTKSRPFILGYKSQRDSGLFAAVYGFRSDTTFGNSGVGGVNLGYILDRGDTTTEVGGSFISAINDAGGMQYTGSAPSLTSGNFGGFGSPTNGTENVKKIPAAGFHVNVTMDSYNLTAEWVGTVAPFRVQDLSMNGRGAQPQAIQLEAGKTFRAFDKPMSVAIDYQWSKDGLALNLPKQRVSTVFNISIWKDTVESLEYRHDFNYGVTQYANGAAPAGWLNANTYGRGGASDTLLAQIGIYF